MKDISWLDLKLTELESMPKHVAELSSTRAMQLFINDMFPSNIVANIYIEDQDGQMWRYTYSFSKGEFVISPLPLYELRLMLSSNLSHSNFSYKLPLARKFPNE